MYLYPNMLHGPCVPLPPPPPPSPQIRHSMFMQVKDPNLLLHALVPTLHPLGPLE